jgi:putative restriction endonuclease
MSSAERKPWTREELILAINLYCKTPFGRIHVRNPEIISLADRMNRTPGSVSYKLANFASIDPSLPRKGASNVSKLDKEVWADFFENWDEMAYQSEKSFSGEKIVEILDENTIKIPEGKTRESIVKVRVNQSFFRKTILASYGACCITGIPTTELLVASHIIPWSKDENNRTNPRNGLCLNCLHDKAFDVGLITISSDFSIIVSPQIKKHANEQVRLITAYEGKTIALPKRFLPDQELLDYHRNNIFQSD